MLHIVGIVVVSQLPIVPEAHDEIVGVCDLVGGDDARTERRKGIERLAEPAHGLAGGPSAPTLAARRDIDEASVAEHGIAPALARDHLGWALEDQRKLGLVHE